MKPKRTFNAALRLTAAVCIALTAGAASAAPSATLDPKVQAYFVQHCLKCHDIYRGSNPFNGPKRFPGSGVYEISNEDHPIHAEMLPYGSIYYNGAPAALKDIPLGTHLHGWFYQRPETERHWIIKDVDDKKRIVTFTFFDSVDPEIFKELPLPV